ncbi:MAG: hypothetical protein ACXAC7_23660 [Candidatus Hodarchaeales archaeon]
MKQYFKYRNDVFNLIVDTIKDGIKDKTINSRLNPQLLAFTLMITSVSTAQMLTQGGEAIQETFGLISKNILMYYFMVIRKGIKDGNKED